MEARLGGRSCFCSSLHLRIYRKNRDHNATQNTVSWNAVTMIPFIPLPAHTTGGDADNNKRAREADETDETYGTDPRVLHVTVSSKYRSGVDVSMKIDANRLSKDEIDEMVDTVKASVKARAGRGKTMLMMPHSTQVTDSELEINIWFVEFPNQVVDVIIATTEQMLMNKRQSDTLKFHFAKPDEGNDAENSHSIEIAKVPPNPEKMANPSDGRPRSVTVSVVDFEAL